MQKKTDLKSFHPKTRAAWRNWLEAHHDKLPGVWFTFYKKESGKRRVTYDEAVEEALCFGWIDSLPKKIDEHRSALKFSPRKPKSVWSELNIKRVQELIDKKLMTPVGLQKIERAKADGSWDILSASNHQAKTGVIPVDLEKALKKSKEALTNFKAFSPSTKKQFLSWIDSAKRPETRLARITQTVAMSAAKKKPGANGFKL
jgi:uncharacterized protein YdeI (YjbR/CyaY-like superfamily)